MTFDFRREATALPQPTLASPSSEFRFLYGATLCYLAFPILLFLLFWLRLSLAVFLSLGLCAALWTVLRHLPQAQRDDGQLKQFWRTLFFTYAPIGFYTLFAGAGGFGVVEYDWKNKHNLVLADLMRHSWPVQYVAGDDSLGQEPLNLVYYVAYYLSASLVGKLLGWTAANISLQIWTQLGMFLIAAWIVCLLGPRTLWAGLLFIAFSGADQLGQYLTNMVDLHHGSRPPDWHILSNDLWWLRWIHLKPYYVLYRSNLVQLFWAPQHLIAGCLGAALLIRHHRREASSLSRDVFVLALLPLWSPFAVVGCLPFVIWNFLGERRSASHQESESDAPQRRRLKGYAVLGYSLILLILWGLFFSSRVHPLLSPSHLSTPQDTARGEHLEFLPLRFWHDAGWLSIPAYLLFDIIEFALLLALAYPLLKERATFWRGYAGVAALILFTLQFWVFGLYNDLMMRAAIPALFVLFLIVMQTLTLTSVRRWKWPQWGLAFLLFWGGGHFYYYSHEVASCFKSALRQARHGDGTGLVHIEKLSEMPTLYEQYRHDPRRQLVTQYVGDQTSLFARYLMRE